MWARKVPPWEETPGLRSVRCNCINKVNRVCRSAFGVCTLVCCECGMCARLLCMMCSVCARASVGCVHVFGMRNMCVHVCSTVCCMCACLVCVHGVFSASGFWCVCVHGCASTKKSTPCSEENRCRVSTAGAQEASLHLVRTEVGKEA